jgi:protein-arginine kinase activator protein McsA
MSLPKCHYCGNWLRDSRNGIKIFCDKKCRIHYRQLRHKQVFGYSRSYFVQKRYIYPIELKGVDFPFVHLVSINNKGIISEGVYMTNPNSKHSARYLKEKVRRRNEINKKFLQGIFE